MLFKTLLFLKKINYYYDVCSNVYNSIKIGGPIKIFILFFFLNNEKKIIKILKDNNFFFFFLGKKTNFLISSFGFFGIFFLFLRFKVINRNNYFFFFNSCTEIKKFLNYLFFFKDLSIFNFLNIPGTLGGLIKNNSCLNYFNFYLKFSKFFFYENLVFFKIKFKYVFLKYRNSNLPRNIFLFMACFIFFFYDNFINFSLLRFGSKKKNFQFFIFSLGSIFKNSSFFLISLLLEKFSFRNFFLNSIIISSFHSNVFCNFYNGLSFDIFFLFFKLKLIFFLKFKIFLRLEIYFA